MDYGIEELRENSEEVKKQLAHARRLEELVKELDFLAVSCNFVRGIKRIYIKRDIS